MLSFIVITLNITRLREKCGEYVLYFSRFPKKLNEQREVLRMAESTL